MATPMDCERSLVGPNHPIARRALGRTAHTNRWLAGAACVCAFSLPLTVAWVRRWIRRIAFGAHGDDESRR